MTEQTDISTFNGERFAATIDATGLICPEPIMMLHGAVRDITEGQLVKVIATDPSTKKDIANFCEFLGHVLENHQEYGETFLFVVRKGKKA